MSSLIALGFMAGAALLAGSLACGDSEDDGNGGNGQADATVGQPDAVAMADAVSLPDATTGMPDVVGMPDATGMPDAMGMPDATGMPDAMAGVCGDGNVDEGEDCDDGNDVRFDGCTECEVTACEACEDMNCRDFPDSAPEDRIDLCFNAMGNATAGPGLGTSKAELCADIIACARDNDCVATINGPQDCLCGDIDEFACLGGPMGPCLTEIQRGAESTVPAIALPRLVDPGFASGAAGQLLECDARRCVTECGVN